MRLVLIAGSVFLLLSYSHALQNEGDYSEPIDTEEIEPVQTLPKPNADKTAKANRLSTQLSVYVREYRFDGNTVFSDDELAQIALPYSNREINTEELIELKDKITSHYVNNGFINSGAILPDQDIGGGIIVFKIQEGIVENTQILKTKHLADHYILSRVERGIRQPLNIFELEENFKILEQDSNIESIQATLEPGSALGSGILSIEVQEADRWDGGFEINNHNPTSVGLYSAELYTEASNLTGMGESLGVNVGWRFDDTLSFKPDENIFYSFYGSIPVTRWDTTLSASFNKNVSNIIDENFRDLDIRNETYNYDIEIRHPVYRTPNQEFGLAVRLAHTRTSTTLSGVEFAFGSDQPEDRITTLSLIQDWIYKSQKEVIALYSSVNFGIDLLDATMDVSGNSPDASFVTWLLQGHYLRQLETWDSQILFKGTLRLSDDAVLPPEKFTLGGVFSVRGYRENTLTRDYGALANIEYRVPMFELRFPHLIKKRGDGQVQLTVFYDYGWAENFDDTRGIVDTNFLHSVGTGFLWQINPHSSSELYWGYPLKPVNYDSEYDIQEAGIHFRINFGLF